AAKNAEKDARDQAIAANESRKLAERAGKAAAEEEQKAELAAKTATEQKAAAERNLLAAKVAQSQAEKATSAAKESAQEVLGALERGELIRVGLESSRREDFNQAQGAFEQLEQKLNTLQAHATGSQKFSERQLRQFARDYGWTLSHLGDTYHKLREFDKAIEHYEKGRVILESILKDEPAAILLETYYGLAHAYHDSGMFRASAAYGQAGATSSGSEQQLSKAEEFYKKAADYQQSLKPDNPVVLVASLKNLAQLYLDIGRYEDAEKSFKTVVDTYKSIEDAKGDRSRTISALKELAEFYRTRSRFEDAAATYTELIDVYENVGDFNHLEPHRIRELADTYSELGQIYIAMKDEARGNAAFELVEKIQGLQLKIKQKGPLKPNDPASTFDDDMDQMGDIYLKLGRFAQAKRSYETALEIREGVQAENRSRASSYLKLGNLYRDHYNDYAKAESYYKKLIDDRKNVKGQFFGPNDPLSQYVNGLRQLALLYTDKLNRLTEGEALFNEALGALGPVQGRLAWDDEVAIYDDLIKLYRKQQKDVQPVNARKLAAMTARRDSFSSLLRSPEYQQFSYPYVQTAGEVADYYLQQNNKAAALAAYAQVFNNINLAVSTLNAKQLGTYLTHIEKYQQLLRENKNETLAAKFDDFVKRGRSRLKELESVQPQESN